MIDGAIDEFKKALAYKPKDKEIHQKLGIAYTAKGWTDKAKDEFTLYHEQDKPIKKSHKIQLTAKAQSTQRKT